MRRLAVAAMVAVVVAPTAHTALGPPATSCGVERWAVKTLQDPGATRVRVVPKPTTVAALRKLPVRRAPGDSRGAGAESTLWQVTAKLVAAKIEEDSDVHLIVADPKTRGQMILELPHPSCALKATVGIRARMRNARDALFRACGIPGSDGFTALNGTATIRGVGFFDFLHGQRGVAPNGVELHPVLYFRAVSCTASATSPAGGGDREPTKPWLGGGSSGKCEPGYSPCLPIVADLNCADIPAAKKPVRVTGPDRYRLDADHDGVGCESG